MVSLDASGDILWVSRSRCSIGDEKLQLTVVNLGMTSVSDGERPLNWLNSRCQRQTSKNRIPKSNDEFSSLGV